MSTDVENEELFISTLKDCEEELIDIIEYDVKINNFYSSLIDSLAHSLEVITPKECQNSVKKLLWETADNYEFQIRYHTAVLGWHYSKLDFHSIIGLKAIISSGYLPTGSDSEELYKNSLPEYVKTFPEKIKKYQTNRVLWELGAYIDLLLTIKNKYKLQLEQSIDLLIKIITKEGSKWLNKANIQIIGYIVSILKDYKDNSEDERIDIIIDEINKLIGNFENWPDNLEIKILLLFDILKINNKIHDPIIKKYIEITEEYKTSTYKKQICKPYMLRLISEYSKKNRMKYQIPYFTLSGYETQFFGIVIETILDISDHLETERRSEALNYQETDLRNRLLSALRIRFEGGATPETFNVKGYTDIYVNNPKDSREHVIIECKIFKGQKKYIDSIDQTMKYLQEKDGRAILVTFIKNTEYLETLKTIPLSIKNHPTYQKNSLKNGVLGKSSWRTNTYFTSIHKNKSGSDVRIHHIYVDVREKDIY